MSPAEISAQLEQAIRDDRISPMFATEVGQWLEAVARAAMADALELAARIADGYPIATEPGWRSTVAAIGSIVDQIRALKGKP